MEPKLNFGIVTLRLGAIVLFFVGTRCGSETQEQLLAED